MLKALDEKQAELLELGLRQSRVWSFWKELGRRVTGTKERIEIGNPLAWDAVVSLDRMLTIDAVNWALGLDRWIGQHLVGSAFSDLRATKTRSAKLSNAIRGRADAPAWVLQARAQSILTGHRAALATLFGAVVAKRGKAEAKDVLRLRARLKRSAAGLAEHRNAQAHRYGYAAAPKRDLSRRRLAEHLRRWGAMLNALRLLVDQSHHAMPPFKASSGNWGDGLVDLVLLGSTTHAAELWKDEPGDYFWQKREAHYKRRRRGSAR
jgi:hypothetical protein